MLSSSLQRKIVFLSCKYCTCCNLLNIVYQSLVFRIRSTDVQPFFAPDHPIFEYHLCYGGLFRLRKGDKDESHVNTFWCPPNQTGWKHGQTYGTVGKRHVTGDVTSTTALVNMAQVGTLL